MKHSEPLAEKQIERERIQDVLLLVEQLFASQDTTFKLIIDCLYDIASVNLINQKVKPRSVNRLTKTIASTSKPVFRLIAFYWVKRNCPKLVTNWLYGQVTFGQRDLSELEYSREVVAQAIDQYERAQHEREQQAMERDQQMKAMDVPFEPSPELQRLQGQVKLLQGMLACSVLALGGAAAWIVYDMNPELSNRKISTESLTTLDQCDLTSSTSALCRHR